MYVLHCTHIERERVGGREGGREGAREGGSERGRKRGREGGREGGGRGLHVPPFLSAPEQVSSLLSASVIVTLTAAIPQ